MHLFLAVIVLFSLVQTSESHVTITPSEGRPGLWDVYVLSVPTEGESPTVEVELVVPQSHEIEAIGYQKEWSFTAERDDGGLVRRIQWQGGRIPPLTFNEFKFYAKNPKETGAYWWTVYQKLENGEESTWSSQTFVKEAAAPAEGGSRAGTSQELVQQSQTAMTLGIAAMGIAIAAAVVVGLTLWQTAGKDLKADGKSG